MLKGILRSQIYSVSELLCIQQWPDASPPIHNSVSDHGGSHNKSLYEVFVPINCGNYGHSITSLNSICGTYVKRREHIEHVENGH